MLTVLQVVFAVILIVLILIQERDAGVSGLLGGTGGGAYQTRRGLEKIIFRATITVAVIFAALSIINLISG